MLKNKNILLDKNCKEINRDDQYNPKTLVDNFLTLLDYLIEQDMSLPDHLKKLSDSLSKLKFFMITINMFSKKFFAFIGDPAELRKPGENKISIHEALSRRIESNIKAGKDNAAFHEISEDARLLQPIFENWQSIVDATEFADNFASMPKRLKKQIMLMKKRHIYTFSFYYLVCLAISVILNFICRLFLGEMPSYVISAVIFLINAVYINVKRQQWERNKYWDKFENICEEYTKYKEELNNIILKLKIFLDDENIIACLKNIMENRAPSYWIDTHSN